MSRLHPENPTTINVKEKENPFVNDKVSNKIEMLENAYRLASKSP